MPLHSIINPNSATQIYVWKITETFEDLFDSINLTDISLLRLNTMRSGLHQLGFLSVRMLLLEAGYSDADLQYLNDGKPILIDNKYISISHSHYFSSIAISDYPIGIDIEIVKDKILKIAPRFMNTNHLKNLSEINAIKKATVVWGIKESIFKIKNEKGISFLDHIEEDEFDLRDKKATAILDFENQKEFFRFEFEEIEDYMIVWGFNL